MRTKLLATTLWSTLATLAAGAAAAQTTGDKPIQIADAAPGRERVTVIATRTEEKADEAPATVTVIDAEKIEAELVTDIKDLVRFEPGVSVRNSPARFGAALGATGRDGNSGFNIRGLEGNRVMIQTDGVRVPDGYSYGPTANGRGDYVDLDLLKSVEILRGPASALYGSDGVAGAVSFVTRDPDDLIAKDRAFGLRGRSAYASADESWANSLIGAGRFGDWSAMLAYTRRDAHEQKNQGETESLNSTRTAPNPIDYESNSYLGKIVWAPGDTHRFRLTVDALDSSADADILSGRSATVLKVLSADSTERTRIAFDHRMTFGEGFWRSAQWSLYSQDSDTRQFTFEDRTPAVDRTRDNAFDNSIWGASGQVEMGVDAGWAEHRILLGGDYSVTEQSGIRSGTVPTPPDTFPTRVFPTTDYTLAGVFVQDRIALLDGKLTLYPALRYDAYELDPKIDALYPSTVPVAGSDDSHVSPKFGAVAWPTDWFGAFFSYAAGYKAPEPSQVNNAFSNLAFGYTSVPNPDLKPESSDSLEIGARVRDVSFLGAKWSGEIVAFAADYEDFISQQVVSGSFTPADPAVYQYVNFTDVSISGAEAKLDAAWENGFGLRLAASTADGEVRGAPATPLDTIDPAKLVAGIAYDAPSKAFGGQLILTLVDGKSVEDVASPTLFRPPSFALLDLTAYWSVTPWATLRLGAFNLTDETYWWWGDVRGLSDTSATRDAYTQPGRNVSASLTLRY